MKCWNNKKQIIVNRKIINNNNNQLLLSTFVSFYGWHVPCSAHLAWHAHWHVQHHQVRMEAGAPLHLQILYYLKLQY